MKNKLLRKEHNTSGYSLFTSRCSGLTLIEILIVIAIIALMSTVVGGYYGSVTGEIALNNEANSIIYELRNAQTKAMNGINSAQWGVCFRNPAGDDLYEIVSPAVSCVQGSSGTVVTTIYLQSGITFDNLGGDDFESIIFNKITGTKTTSGDTSINIVSGGQSRTITITAAGNIK